MNIQQIWANTNEAKGKGVLWFYDKVKNGSDWDYKQTGFPGSENFGNVNFGAVGSGGLGIPPAVLLRGAGVAQRAAGTSRPEFGVPWGRSPYGDDPRDQAGIKRGFFLSACLRDFGR